MAIENEFLPMLNSWPLFALVVAVMLGYCFIQYITPHLREWHEEKKQAKQNRTAMEDAPKTSFLSFLDNWMLLFVTMAFGFYWCKINCIDPKLKELREQEQERKSQ